MNNLFGSSLLACMCLVVYSLPIQQQDLEAAEMVHHRSKRLSNGYDAAHHILPFGSFKKSVPISLFTDPMMYSGGLFDSLFDPSNYQPFTSPLTPPLPTPIVVNSQAMTARNSLFDPSMTMTPSTTTMLSMGVPASPFSSYLLPQPATFMMPVESMAMPTMYPFNVDSAATSAAAGLTTLSANIPALEAAPEHFVQLAGTGGPLASPIPGPIPATMLGGPQIDVPPLPTLGFGGGFLRSLERQFPVRDFFFINSNRGELAPTGGGPGLP